MGTIKKLGIFCPLFFGLILAIISRVMAFKIVILNIEFVLNAIINCTATFSGFILTSISILIGLSSTPVINTLRENGNIPELLYRMAEPLVIGTIVLIFCIVTGGKIEGSAKFYILNQMETMFGVGLITAYILSLLFACYFIFSIIGLSSQKLIGTNNKPSRPKGEPRV